MTTASERKREERGKKGMGFFEMVQFTEAEIDRIIRSEDRGDGLMRLVAEITASGEYRTTGNISGWRVA